MKKHLFSTCRGRPGLPALFFACLLLSPAPLPAQGRIAAQEPVDIIIRAARALFLRVGSPGGTIDVVRFDVSALPGSGPVPGFSSGRNPVLLRARAVLLFGQMILTADASTPLDDGSGNTIAFTEIGWRGAGGMPGGVFTGAPNQVLFATGSSRLRGTMSFYYRNVLYRPSGIYAGRVTYTLSSP
ncbi:MAG: hypothetical protein GY849_23770 [Deltaproteobacteria bacterium]|nr:hypothetical protein [Deltaproteobacteria bacterium]